LLANPIYRGMIVHKGRAHPGEHEAIVDQQLFAQVQAKLADNASGSSRRRMHRQPSLLTGLLFDGEGRAMTPSHASRPNKRYRYYVTRPDQVDGAPAWRVPAHDLEQLVCRSVAERLAERGFILDLSGDGAIDAAQLQQVMAKADLAAAPLRSGTDDQRSQLLGTLVRRVYLGEDSVRIALCPRGVNDTLGTPSPLQSDLPALTITAPSARVRRGQRMRLVVPGPEKESQSPPVRRDERLIALVAEAMQARQLVLAHPERSIASIATEHCRCRTRLAKLASLSCVAPDIVAAILEGRQPDALTARTLSAVTLPTGWAEQRRVLGFA
jgi:hypothetical protein